MQQAMALSHWHWAYEPTGGFMESPSSFSRMQWDHQPCQLVGRGVLTAPRLGGLGTARPTLGFMESAHFFSAGLSSTNSGFNLLFGTATK